MRSAVWSWLVVVAVGVLVVVLVLALGLFPRLKSGQEVLDGLGPAFTPERVAGTAAGVDFVHTATNDLLDPVVLDAGGAAAEVPTLVGFLSQQTGLPPAQVLALVKQNFPHVAGLLNAIPFDGVAKELPGLVSFLAATLKITPDQVLAALGQNFPHLSQAVNALPKVTAGWNNVPGTAGFTRFDDTPIKTVPNVSDYFRGDVVPVLQTHQQDFTNLAGSGGVGFLPLLLLALGIIVIVYGLAMMLLASRGVLTGTVGVGAWSVVAVVGVLVVVLVFALQLFPRLDNGAGLLKDAQPIFTSERVTGAEAGVDMVSTVVDMADPVVLESGGAAAEVPKLVGFVSQQTGLPPAAVLSTLEQNFPHTAGLLEAIPLEQVAAELPKLVTFVATTLKVSEETVNKVIVQAYPKLGQAITALPKITSGWANVPGTDGFTRFDGTPIKTATQLRDYFTKDAVPAIAASAPAFNDLNDRWPPINVFPPLLLIVGIIVIIYGLLMMFLVRRSSRQPLVPTEQAKTPVAAK